MDEGVESLIADLNDLIEGAVGSPVPVGSDIVVVDTGVGSTYTNRVTIDVSGIVAVQGFVGLQVVECRTHLKISAIVSTTGWDSQVARPTAMTLVSLLHPASFQLSRRRAFPASCVPVQSMSPVPQSMMGSQFQARHR